MSMNYLANIAHWNQIIYSTEQICRCDQIEFISINFSYYCPQSAEAHKRMIEKFIGDSQAIEITNMQRQKELLDRTVQELAARGVSFMCRSEMNVLDKMLDVYRYMYTVSIFSHYFILTCFLQGVWYPTD